MANKRIIDVDVVNSITETDYIFINQNSTLKQIQKSDIQKPTYTADEVGALPKTTKALPNPKNLVIIQGGVRTQYDGSTQIELNVDTTATLTEAKQFLGIDE